MWYMHPGIGWRLVIDGIGTLLFWGVLIALIVWVVRRVGHHSHEDSRGSDRQDALEIAKLRYARGEITKEQFEEIKRGLTTP